MTWPRAWLPYCQYAYCSWFHDSPVWYICDTLNCQMRYTQWSMSIYSSDWDFWIPFLWFWWWYLRWDHRGGATLQDTWEQEVRYAHRTCSPDRWRYRVCEKHWGIHPVHRYCRDGQESGNRKWWENPLAYSRRFQAFQGNHSRSSYHHGTEDICIHRSTTSRTWEYRADELSTWSWVNHGACNYPRTSELSPTEGSQESIHMWWRSTLCIILWTGARRWSHTFRGRYGTWRRCDISFIWRGFFFEEWRETCRLHYTNLEKE